MFCQNITATREEYIFIKKLLCFEEFVYIFVLRVENKKINIHDLNNLGLTIWKSNMEILVNPIMQVYSQNLEV